MFLKFKNGWRDQKNFQHDKLSLSLIILWIYSQSIHIFLTKAAGCDHKMPLRKYLDPAPEEV